jgi:lipopolysaccharide export system permease protein
MSGMKIIDRYIGSAVISATLSVLMVLLGIFAFFAFIDELEELGRGAYGLTKVVLVVALRVPGLAYDLMPIAALIGALLALGAMMERNEIPVIRCAGVSRTRVVWSAMRAGVVFALLAVVIGEFVFPPAERLARELRATAMNEQMSRTSEQGFWARDGNSFINIREVLPGQQFRDINILEFDAANRLRIATHAASANYRDGRWELRDLEQTLFDDGRIRSRSLAEATWDSLLDPELIGMVSISPDSLSLLDLARYIRFTEANGQSAERWKHSLWVKVAYPLATAVMVFLSIPLVLAASRAVPTGRRILTGALIGLAFHVLNEASGHLGVVAGVPAVLSALGPTLLLFGLGLFMHRRTS